MRYFLPLLVRGDDERPAVFKFGTSAGPTLPVFSDEQKRDAFLELSAPTAEQLGGAMGYAEIELPSRDELEQLLTEIAPGTAILPDWHPDFDRIVAGAMQDSNDADDPDARARQIYDAFWELLTAATWADARAIAETHAALRSAASIPIIDAFCTAAAMHDPELAPLATEVGRLLKASADEGVAAAFARKRPGDDPVATLPIAVASRLVSPRVDVEEFFTSNNPAALAKGLRSLERLLRHPGYGSAGGDVRADILVAGAEVYFIRYTSAGEAPEDLERAIALAEDALAASPRDRELRARCCSLLGSALSARHDQLRAGPADLDRAAAVLEEAVRLTPADHPARTVYLNNLGVALRERFVLDGDAATRDRGIAVLDEAARRAAADSPDQARALTNVSTLLAGVDSSRAIETARRAMEMAGREPALALTARLNLANALRHAYGQTSERTLLDEAIAVLEPAKELARAPFSRALLLLDLGRDYRRRFEWTSRVADLEAAVGSFEESLTLMPAGAARRPELLKDLALALLQLAQNSGGAGLPEGFPLPAGRPSAEAKARIVPMMNRAVELAEEAVATSTGQGSLVDGLELAAFAHFVRMKTPAATAGDWPRVREILARLIERAGGSSTMLAPFLRAGSPAMQAMAVQLYAEATERMLDSSPQHAHSYAWSWAVWMFGEQRWNEAVVPFERLLDARRRLIEVQLARESKEAWLSVLQTEAHLAAYAFARGGRVRAAVLALEEARAHLLTSALLRDRADLDRARLGSALVERYRAAAARAAAIEQQEQHATAVDVREVRAARRELDAVLDEIRRVPGFASFLARPAWTDIEAAMAVARASALVYLTATTAGSLALIVTPSGVEAVWCDCDADALDTLVVRSGYLEAQATGYGMASILPPVLAEIGRRVVGAVARALRRLHATRVVLIPTGSFGLLPLHAATYERDGAGTMLFDEFDVAFAPNARVLAGVRAHADRGTHFVGIGNPLPHPVPLEGAVFEVTAIAGRFPPGEATTVIGTEATAAAVLSLLPRASHLHFACHGLFDPESPFDSRLELAAGDRLRLRDLMNSGDALANTRLVTLSACQSAVTESRRLRDEFIGLPAAFLQAGVPAVVGSLWPVDDVSTALLMIRFYAGAAGNDSNALRGAQQWLRDLTADELRRLFAKYRTELGPRFPWPSPDPGAPERPYANPTHWAAFAFFGSLAGRPSDGVVP